MADILYYVQSTLKPRVQSNQGNPKNKNMQDILSLKQMYTLPRSF